MKYVAIALSLTMLANWHAGAAISAEVAPATDRHDTGEKSAAARPESRLVSADAVEVYKSIGDTHLNLYIFNPPDHSAADHRPAIMFFFGGGWRGGSPGQFVPQCKYFASRGMVAMTADYRVSSRHGTRAIHCVADGKSAIRWTRAHADRLGIDAERIVAAGGSAGGHVAACTGVVTDVDEPEEDASISSRPNALVLFNPVLALMPIDGRHPLGDRAANIEERVGANPRSVSPYDHVRPGLPPTIIFFGTNDRLLFGAQSFQQAATKAGNRCEMFTWEGLPHGFFNHGRFDNKPYVETLQCADAFLNSLGYVDGAPTITTAD